MKRNRDHDEERETRIRELMDRAKKSQQRAGGKSGSANMPAAKKKRAKKK
jgi:hypothetical protein